ncbi:YgeY family selenium metabolism-linked hydrolase [Pseudodesulfovibrio cashew]|uniref:YgeY family selenium metabolism-linked hydrolase n=1 Tax=Pseudodesulfovibrio cashew TaxID=2678688 RepID=A0A6I6J752_9BACT|nr:YgeY family selenium metabolism-linked hydrolase [Pseudodesulfovibrio cashew]QGY38636.1 YgeY family selenium metabolism-linked hydrolase [Pseudodesulfovibrio cashew]
MFQQYCDLAEELREDVTRLASELIRIPSISGTEAALADFLTQTLRGLGYDEVFTDKIGNVVGIIKGDGTGPSVMFNSHMDHVDPGEESLWEYAPYGGEVAGGFVHGRAASDVKAGMAAQIYAGHILKRCGAPLKGDFIFMGVVQEEPAEMFGMRHFCDVTMPERGIDFDLMVSSEATDLDLFLGHRGRAEIEVTTIGRTSHGSAPWRGVNAVYKMIPVLERVQQLAETLPEDPFLGKATCTLTRINCWPGELSITPDKCVVSLDRRLVRDETKEDAMGQIQAILDDLAASDPEFKAEVKLRTVQETSYTGVSAECEKYMHAWAIEENDPLVDKCVAALKAIGQNPGFGKWDFGTDASYVTGVLGIPTIGYSPMEEHYAHTPKDRCDINKLIKATAGNAAIAHSVAS